MKKPSGRREFIARRLLFVADHSSNLIPPDLGDLGLDPSLLNEHIAVDVGVDPLTRTLRDRMGARAYFGSVSRLVLDVNREPDHPGLIPDSSDGILIPGNQDLSDAEVQRRVLKYHHEYHDGLAAEIDTIETKSRGAILVSIHSFTRACVKSRPCSGPGISGCFTIAMPGWPPRRWNGSAKTPASPSATTNPIPAKPLTTPWIVTPRRAACPI